MINEGDLWFDGKTCRIWLEHQWHSKDLTNEEKINYLIERLNETEKITQNYFLLEEVVLDFIKSRPTDKAVIKFREVLEKLYATD
jgi:hypothetical protein